MDSIKADFCKDSAKHQISRTDKNKKTIHNSPPCFEGFKGAVAKPVGFTVLTTADALQVSRTIAACQSRESDNPAYHERGQIGKD